MSRARKAPWKQTGSCSMFHFRSLIVCVLLKIPLPFLNRSCVCFEGEENMSATPRRRRGPSFGATRLVLACVLLSEQFLQTSTHSSDKVGIQTPNVIGAGFYFETAPLIASRRGGQLEAGGKGERNHLQSVTQIRSSVRPACTRTVLASFLVSGPVCFARRAPTPPGGEWWMR